jgi:hypothetical protein
MPPEPTKRKPYTVTENFRERGGRDPGPARPGVWFLKL